jgi:hypothetical protein
MTIPAKTLTTLEYDKVIGRLASHTQTAAGRALALAWSLRRSTARCSAASV